MNVGEITNPLTFFKDTTNIDFNVEKECPEDTVSVIYSSSS
jgi:hypothetical protein